MKAMTQPSRSPPPPILAVDGLTRRFGGLTAVDRCSFHIGASRITGIIGPNGAGKSTIFNMVAGALLPTAGRILFDGEDITGLPAHALFHRGIVRTFQIPHEFGRLTVLENLMAVPADQPGERLWPVWLSPGTVARREREVRERAEETLDFLTLWGLRDELAMNLSGGQKKLLELGRAMMAEPRLVLLDEPGAGGQPDPAREAPGDDPAAQPRARVYGRHHRARYGPHRLALRTSHRARGRSGADRRRHDRGPPRLSRDRRLSRRGRGGHRDTRHAR